MLGSRLAMLAGYFACVVATMAAAGCSSPPRGNEPPNHRKKPEVPPAKGATDPASAGWTAVKWKDLRALISGGGAEPESNQVSIEQDLDLAMQVFSGEKMLLFAGGAGTQGVQVLPDSRSSDSLMLELGELFDPRPWRVASYRPTHLAPAAAATADNVEAAMKLATRAGGEPLFVYLAAHGERGQQDPRDNVLTLWNGGALSVGQAAGALSGKRGVRLVVSACFSGGFAELVFRDADEKKGATEVDRCGLFAATWDTQSTGCDPNPDRRAQEGYGVHFLNALRKLDRDGKPLANKTIDFDGDGHVSLLEAHTRVRIASVSADIPTTTSERWLRHKAPTRGKTKSVELPEEEAVVRYLGAELNLQNGLAAEARLRRLEAGLKEQARALEKLRREVDLRFSLLRSALLERWPVLSDPWHPEFSADLEADRLEITSFLSEEPVWKGYAKARDALAREDEETFQLETQAAHVERLARAYDNLRLAKRLRGRGGSGWTMYERLLACERSVP